MGLTKVTYSMIDGPLVNIKDFGAVGDGVADDTAAIQAAIDYVGELNGGVVTLPQGTYGITDQLNVPYSNVILQGEGADSWHDGALGTGAYPATTLKYIGASTLAKSMISFYTPVGVTEAKRTGGGVQNVFIDCDNKVAGGISLVSYNKGNFLNLTIYYPTYTGVQLNCHQEGTIADAASTQLNIFEQVSVRCLLGASLNAHGFLLTSSDPEHPLTAGANSSFNSFLYCETQVKNGNGLWMNDADNNIFTSFRAFVVSGGTGLGLLLEGAADSNYFYGLSCGTIRIDGTASGRAVNSTRNCFVCVDTGNGTTYPDIDPGCRIYWLDSLGVETNTRSYKTVLADSVYAANLFYDKYPYASVVIPNASNSNAIWCDVNDTNRWRTYTGQVYSATNVDFSVSQLAGSGFFCVEAPLVVRDYMYSPNAPTTASGANMYISTSTTPAGLIYRSTSSVKYKTDIEDIQPEYSDNLLKMRPIWYRSTSPMDKKDWSWFGLLAEEVAEIEPRLVDWSYAEDCYETDESGKKVLKENAELTPDGVFYDRITALLIDLVQRQEARISELEKKVNESN